jgi:hypothetical protein
VCTTFSRGRSPERLACRVTENAPEITAWEAITVARAANTTNGIRAQPGARWKNGLSMGDGSRRIIAPIPR